MLREGREAVKVSIVGYFVGEYPAEPYSREYAGEGPVFPV